MNATLCRLALIVLLVSATSCALLQPSRKPSPAPPPPAEADQEIKEPPPRKTEEEPQPDQKVRVVKSGARLRSGPSTGSDIIATLNPGEVLRMIKDLGSWIRVEGPDGREAYIYWNLVERVDDSDIAQQPPSPPPVDKPAVFFDEIKTCVTAVGSNVRSGPGTRYDPPVMAVPEGTVMAADGRTGNWYHGTLNGVSGWIHSSLLKEEEEPNTIVIADEPEEIPLEEMVYEPVSGEDQPVVTPEPAAEAVPPGMEPAPESAEPAAGKTIVGDSPVKVREGPSPLTRVITELAPGTQVDVVERSNTWIKIKTETTEGYIPASALTGEQ